MHSQQQETHGKVVPMLVPPALRPGDLVDVVAPSSPFDRALAWRGLGWLRTRYRVRFDRKMFEVDGYLAGSEERRLQEMNRALRSRETRAIVAVRGGFGVNHIAHQLDWEAFRKHPKWIVGFSDITALHVEAAALDVASLHAPMVALLGRSHEPTRKAWIEAVEAPERARSWYGLATIHIGQARGRSFGGNLAMLHACAAAGRLHMPKDTILFVEDVGERPYRVDRALTNLIVGGHLAHVRGVVLGEFKDCYPGTDNVSIQDVVRRLVLPLRIPVACGFPMGHGLINEPLHLGARVELEVNAKGATVSLVM